MKNRKLLKILLSCIAVVIIVLISVFGFRVYDSYKAKKVSTDNILVAISKVEDNENQMKATVNINDESIFISEYSFDGGKTWQPTNTYIITDNRTLDIKLKDIDGNIIGEKEYKVTTIDHEGPVIEVTLPTEIEKGTSINLSSYIRATDKSGLKEPITITPSNLDTNTVGNKRIQIKAIDTYSNETVINVEIQVIEKETSNDNQNSGSNNNTGNNNNSGNNNHNSGSNNSSGSNNNTGNGNQNNGSSNTPKPTKKTYYRYRTKTIKQYECNYYQCNSIDYNNNIDVIINFDSDSYCCTEDYCSKQIPAINTPCPIGKTCIQVMTERFKNKGNVCYDSTYITLPPSIHSKKVCDKDEIKIDGYCHKIESKGTYPAGCTTSDCVVFNDSSPCSGKTYNPSINTPCPYGGTCIQVMTEKYQVKDNVCYDSTYITVSEPFRDKTVCDENEINIDGYCHKIDSKGTYSCPPGYKQTSDTKCSQIIEKTCNETCTSEIWSDWSSWSTTKVVESDTVEVQTKQM